MIASLMYLKYLDSSSPFLNVPKQESRNFYLNFYSIHPYFIPPTTQYQLAHICYGIQFTLSFLRKTSESFFIQ
jgi:hypothetical protein